MNSEPENDQSDRRSPASRQRGNQPFSFVNDVLNSPAMQLQKSLAAQQALLKSTFALPDLSAALKPPGLSTFQDIQRQLALQHTLQKTVSTELANTSLALRTAQNRILAEVQAVSRAAEATKAFQDAVKQSSILPQIVSGRLLTEMRSIAAARAHAASAMRPYLDALTKVRELASKDILSSVRAAAVAQSAITKQLESVRQSQTFRSSLAGNLQTLQVRISAIRLDKLTELAEEVAAKDAVFSDWTQADSEEVALQIESELAAIPESAGWGIEEQLNYLINWTVKQDNEETKRNLVSFLINILAAIVFALGLQAASTLVLYDQPERPQIIVRYVRQQIQEHPVHSADADQLRIVCKRAVPVKSSRRRRSKRIATLHAGCVVRACEKYGKWVHIEWADPETGLAMEGWVLSKHLARVNKTASASLAVDRDVDVHQDESHRKGGNVDE